MQNGTSRACAAQASALHPRYPQRVLFSLLKKTQEQIIEGRRKAGETKSAGFVPVKKRVPQNKRGQKNKQRKGKQKRARAKPRPGSRSQKNMIADPRAGRILRQKERAAVRREDPPAASGATFTASTLRKRARIPQCAAIRTRRHSGACLRIQSYICHAPVVRKPADDPAIFRKFRHDYACSACAAACATACAAIQSTRSCTPKAVPPGA